ncbi:effector-associated domain 2-containing protein [Actinomadura bangladeshensis]|uniref:effector-associated domain 2-containing protein n=2 Tax=Actinomadura bangladeshensis TaxID=453573 RepID=UPI0031E327FF
MSESGGGWTPNGLCSLFACDIASFGHPARTDLDRRKVRKALYEGLRASFDADGIGFPACYREDRGDGALVVVPPDVDTARLITSLIDLLRGEVRRHNEVSSATAHMQLRVAVHTGVAHSDGEGLVGTAVNHVFRLLEADALRQGLLRSGAELALIASDRVHEDVIRHGPGMVHPGEYHRIDVQVKETVAHAWVRLPGVPAAGRPVPGPPRVTRTVRVLPPPAEPTEIDPPPHPPPPPALPPASVTIVERPRGLDAAVDVALTIRQLRGRRLRDQIVAELPLALATVIGRRRAEDDRDDMAAIVGACREHPQGVAELLRAVRQFAGDSAGLEEFRRSVEALGRA